MDIIIETRSAVPLVLAEVAERLNADAGVLIARVEDAVTARVQARMDLSEAVQDAVRRGVVAGVRDSLARLYSNDELQDELPPDLTQLARQYHDQDWELVDLADAWLVGQEAFWDCFGAMTERLVDDTALCWNVVKAAREQLSGHSARMFELFCSISEEPSEGTSASNDSSALDAVSRALRGIWVCADELGYDLSNSHLGVIADTASVLNGLAQHTGRQVLLVPTPADGVWGWLGGRPQLSDAEVDKLVAWQSASGGGVAFGEPADGIAGFAASHHQAIEARNIASATGERVARFADVRLLVAVLRDSHLAQGFVERELGELAVPSMRGTELRETLRVYLEHGQNVSTTAALRRRDRKTIQRQLHIIEQITHHSTHDRSDALLVALRASDILRRRQQATSAP